MILTMQLTTMQTQVTLACHKNSGGLNEKERDELKDYAGKIKKEILQKTGLSSRSVCHKESFCSYIMPVSFPSGYCAGS